MGALWGFRLDEAHVLEHFNQACAALAAEVDAVALRATADAQGRHIGWLDALLGGVAWVLRGRGEYTIGTEECNLGVGGW
jgi:hypothetical protein